MKYRIHYREEDSGFCLAIKQRIVFEENDHMENNNHVFVFECSKDTNPVVHFSSCFLHI